VFETADPYSKVNVHKTGKLLSSDKLECVKLVVLAFVPPDDHAVRKHVRDWDDEVDFIDKVGRLCELSHVSTLYNYNAQKIAQPVLLDLFAHYPWAKDQNIVLRPADTKGEP
jgi:hypothetical protein